MSCAFCGRETEAGSRFGFGYGTPVHPSATRVWPEYVPRPSRGQRHLRAALNAGALSFASRGMVENQTLRAEQV